MRLLVIEDDPDLNRQLATALTDAGYVVDRAFDGEEGHYLGETEPYDAVILDIGLPKMDGISVLEAWRRAGRAMPVLMLTARDRWSDKVQGFDAGADDYVPKPFHLEEVLARVRALLRRGVMRANPLALRLFLSATTWTVVILMIPGVALSSLYQRSVERAFDRRLSIYLKTLIADVASPEEAGEKFGQRGEPLFELPLSGWYWQVTRLNAPRPDVRASRSLWDGRLAHLAQLDVAA